jgi:hypothetical protein
MRTSVSLRDIRSAIRGGRRMTFLHGQERVVADFYMLGHAKNTRAYVVVAWCHEPAPEWRHLRYSMIYDLEPLGLIENYRPDFDPYDPRIEAIDCMGLFVPHGPPH